MLVDEHTNRDAAHIEAVQKVLNVLAGDGVRTKRIFVFNDPLSHGGHHVIVPVPDGHQGIVKPLNEYEYGGKGRFSKHVKALIQTIWRALLFVRWWSCLYWTLTHLKYCGRQVSCQGIPGFLSDSGCTCRNTDTPEEWDAVPSPRRSLPLRCTAHYGTLSWQSEYWQGQASCRPSRRGTFPLVLFQCLCTTQWNPPPPP